MFNTNKPKNIDKQQTHTKIITTRGCDGIALSPVCSNDCFGKTCVSCIGASLLGFYHKLGRSWAMFVMTTSNDYDLNREIK